MEWHKIKKPRFFGLSNTIQIQQFSIKIRPSWYFQPEPGALQRAVVQRGSSNLARGDAAVLLDRCKFGRVAVQAPEELFPEHIKLLGASDRNRRVGRQD